MFAAKKENFNIGQYLGDLLWSVSHLGFKLVVITTNKLVANLDISSFVDISVRLFPETELIKEPKGNDQCKSDMVTVLLLRVIIGWSHADKEINRLGGLSVSITIQG